MSLSRLLGGLPGRVQPFSCVELFTKTGQSLGKRTVSSMFLTGLKTTETLNWEGGKLWDCSNINKGKLKAVTDSEAVHLKLVLLSGWQGFGEVLFIGILQWEGTQWSSWLYWQVLYLLLYFFCRAVGTDKPLCIYKKLCCDSARVRINLQVHHLFFLFCAEAELKQT